MEKIIVGIIKIENVIAELVELLNIEEDLSFECIYNSPDADAAPVIYTKEIVVDGESMDDEHYDKANTILSKYIKEQLTYSRVLGLEDEEEIEFPLESDNFKAVAETEDDVYIKRFRGCDNDEYGLRDGLFYAQVSYANYKRMKEVYNELSKSKHCAQADIYNCIYIDEIYSYKGSITFENRNTVAKVYDAGFDSYEAILAGNNIIIECPFKHTRGGLEAEEYLYYSDIEEFFAPLEDKSNNTLPKPIREELQEVVIEDMANNILDQEVGELVAAFICGGESKSDTELVEIACDLDDKRFEAVYEDNRLHSAKISIEGHEPFTFIAKVA